MGICLHCKDSKVLDDWICCDSCGWWMHNECEGLPAGTDPKSFICRLCTQNAATARTNDMASFIQAEAAFFTTAMTNGSWYSLWTNLRFSPTPAIARAKLAILRGRKLEYAYHMEQTMSTWLQCLFTYSFTFGVRSTQLLEGLHGGIKMVTGRGTIFHHQIVHLMRRVFRHRVASKLSKAPADESSQKVLMVRLRSAGMGELVNAALVDLNKCGQKSLLEEMDKASNYKVTEIDSKTAIGVLSADVLRHEGGHALRAKICVEMNSAGARYFRVTNCRNDAWAGVVIVFSNGSIASSRGRTAQCGHPCGDVLAVFKGGHCKISTLLHLHKIYHRSKTSIDAR